MSIILPHSQVSLDGTRIPISSADDALTYTPAFETTKSSMMDGSNAFYDQVKEIEIVVKVIRGHKQAGTGLLGGVVPSNIIQKLMLPHQYGELLVISDGRKFTGRVKIGAHSDIAHADSATIDLKFYPVNSNTWLSSFAK